MSVGVKIYTDPRPCGWRWKCAITIDGYDGEVNCITVPGCQFWHDTIEVPSSDMHPNFITYDEPCPD